MYDNISTFRGGVAHLGAQGKQSRTPNKKTKYVLFKHSNPYGGIAQLGERLNGIQEVSGSIPLISTKKCLKSTEKPLFSNKNRGFFLVALA